MELYCAHYPRVRKRAKIESSIIKSLKAIIPKRLNAPLPQYNLSLDFEGRKRIAIIQLSDIEDFALIKNTMIANETFGITSASTDLEVLDLIEKEIMIQSMIKFKISTDMQSVFFISGFTFPGFTSSYFKTKDVSIDLCNFHIIDGNRDNPVIRYDLHFRINNFSYFYFGQKDEDAELNIKCLRKNKYSDAFNYAIELMKKNYTRASIGIHENECFWGDFSITVPNCGDIEILTKFFGEEYDIMPTQSSEVIISKLKISPDATLIAKSEALYELGGIKIIPFDYIRVSGYPKIIFDNFNCTAYDIHSFSITLVIRKPRYS